MRTVMVTGGAGYIGSHVVLALTDAGRRVLVLDNLSTGHRDLVPDGVPLVVGDVADTDRVRHLLRSHDVSTVMHFAGSIIVPESIADPMKYYRNNVAASLALIDACLAVDIPHFIFSSTATLYGDAGTDILSEQCPARPVSPYGWSKWMIEQVLADVGRPHPLRHVCLRYFNVAGADPSGRSGQVSANATHLIKVACEHAVGRREHFAIFGTDYPTPDGTCIRDYIHVSDLADAHLRALTYLEAGGDSLVLNCGYGRGHSVRQVVASLARVLDRPFPVPEVARRPGDPAILVADSKRLRERLGWHPRFDDLDLIIRHALAWERRR